MMKGQTKQATPVYTKPVVDPKFLALHILPYREFELTTFETVINPYGGNKEDICKFGKTTAGWMLLSHNGTIYFEEDPCPICLCEISDDIHFKLPCCENEIHVQCWLMQINSFKGGLWSESHISCSYCKHNMFEGKFQYKWFWMDYRPLRDVIYKIPGFKWGEQLEEPILRNWRNYNNIKKMIEEKDKEVPEDERGGWAVQICDLCKEPGIAGKLSCAEEMNLDLSSGFVCEACEWGAREAKDHRCFVHGKKYAMFKCDSCCSPAIWDCFSNHYCDRCHDMACETKNFPCPGPGKCPLGVAHPRNSHGRHGEKNLGFVLGCFKCIDPNYEVNACYSANAPDPFREADLDNGHISLFNYSAPPPPKPVVEEPPKPIAEPIVEEPEAPVQIRVIEAPEEEFSDSPEENEIYDEFISQFQNSDVESSSSESEFEDLSIYQGFIAHFSDDELSFSESEFEDLSIYQGFISHFSDDELSFSETDSSEIELEEEESLAFEDIEEQVLPIISPRSMVYNSSIDSLYSEDTMNLLNFNQGFLSAFEDDEDVVLPNPLMMNMASSQGENVTVSVV